MLNVTLDIKFTNGSNTFKRIVSETVCNSPGIQFFADLSEISSKRIQSTVVTWLGDFVSFHDGSVFLVNGDNMI